MPLFYYLLAANTLTFALMGLDKLKARKGARRIPEKVLFLFVILGGSVGGIIGMLLFRHKTRHWYFAVGFPVILVIQLAVALLLKR